MSKTLAFLALLAFATLACASTPSHPSIPTAFSATLKMTVSGHISVDGKMFFDATGNRMRIDGTYNSTSFETLILYAEGKQYAIDSAQSFCQSSTTGGNASDLFRALPYTQYNGTLTVNGQQVTKWIFSAAKIYYLFAGDTPVAFSVQDAVTYEWSDVDMNEPDAAVWTVPSYCNGKESPSMHPMHKILIHASRAHSSPVRPSPPQGWIADITVTFPNGTSLGGTEAFDVLGNRVRLDLNVNNNKDVVEVLYLYNQQLELDIVNGQTCERKNKTGFADDVFVPLRFASFNGTVTQQGKTMTRWVADDGTYTYIFLGNTPVSLEIHNLLTFAWSNMTIETPDNSVFNVPSQCVKSANAVHAPTQELLAMLSSAH